MAEKQQQVSHHIFDSSFDLNVSGSLFQAFCAFDISIAF